MVSNNINSFLKSPVSLLLLGAAGIVVYFALERSPPLLTNNSSFSRIHHRGIDTDCDGRDDDDSEEMDDAVLSRVSNDSYSLYNDHAKADGFAGAAAIVSPYTTSNSFTNPYDANSISSASPLTDPYSQLPVNTTNPVATASIGDTTTVPSIIVDPPTPDDPKIINIQNQILKMIIANTSSVNTVLSNIDTIKESIEQYKHKLHLVFQQLRIGGINQVQLQQYLLQIISDIATDLQIPMQPQFAQRLNQSPYSPISPIF